MMQIENSFGASIENLTSKYAPTGETDLNKLDIERLRQIDKERRKTERGLA